jgi:hypothetical protein
MTVPPFILKYIKTTGLHEDNPAAFQYWFQWQQRTNPSAQSKHYVRIDLLDETGKLLAIASGRLPKARIIGYKPATRTQPRKRIYDAPQLILVEHDIKAVSFDIVF